MVPRGGVNHKTGPERSLVSRTSTPSASARRPTSTGSMARMTAAGTPASAYPGVAYPASKAAVNMVTVQYAKAFPKIRVNAVEPGFTATDLNAFQGT